MNNKIFCNLDLIDIIVPYSRTCLKKPLKKKTKIVF